MKRVRTLSKFFDCDRKDVRGWDVIRNHSPPFCEQRWIEIRTLSGDKLKDCSASNDIIMHASSGILISSEIIRLNEQHPWKSVRRYVIRLWNGRARLLMSNNDGRFHVKILDSLCLPFSRFPRFLGIMLIFNSVKSLFIFSSNGFEKGSPSLVRKFYPPSRI